MTHAGADGLCSFPGFRTFQVRVPEWPGTTLRRPYGIDRAAPRLPVEERAVAVSELAQSDPAAMQLRVVDSHFAKRQSAKFGNFTDLVVGHPDNSRTAGTTVSALTALKTKSFMVPR